MLGSSQEKEKHLNCSVFLHEALGLAGGGMEVRASRTFGIT